MTPADILRLTALLLSIVGFILWFRWMIRDCELRLIAIGPITWLINMTLFYLARQFGVVSDPVTLNLWSSAIHIHALLLLIAAGWLLCRR